MKENLWLKCNTTDFANLDMFLMGLYFEQEPKYKTITIATNTEVYDYVIEKIGNRWIITTA